MSTDRHAAGTMVTRMTRDEVVAAIQGCADELRERFGVRSLRLFGSVARNEAAEGSDVDVLVEFEGPRTFRGYMDLRGDLSTRKLAQGDMGGETPLPTRQEWRSGSTPSCPPRAHRRALASGLGHQDLSPYQYLPRTNHVTATPIGAIPPIAGSSPPRGLPLPMSPRPSLRVERSPARSEQWSFQLANCTKHRRVSHFPWTCPDSGSTG
jgi:predicted nucleotidyltransferase